MTGTFVLTTGRSGSTFLARALNSHPDLVVVSDLLEPALTEIYFDPHLHLDGASFWEVLSRPSIPERIRYWRNQPTDELLFLPESDRDVSLLMAYTLPFLTTDPWRLLDELRTAICARPDRPASDHFAFVLDFLRDRFRGTTWIERTGGSLPHTGAIVAEWPAAKFVVLHRDPVEIALSMRSGSFFRLYLAMAAGESSSWLDERFADPAALAAMIEGWVEHAERTLSSIPDQQLRRVTYERLTREPVAFLRGLLRFVLERELTSTDDDWVASCAAEVEAAPSRASTVTAAELGRVRAACARATETWKSLVARGC